MAKVTAQDLLQLFNASYGRASENYNRQQLAEQEAAARKAQQDAALRQFLTQQDRMDARSAADRTSREKIAADRLMAEQNNPYRSDREERLRTKEEDARTARFDKPYREQLANLAKVSGMIESTINFMRDPSEVNFQNLKATEASIVQSAGGNNKIGVLLAGTMRNMPGSSSAIGDITKLVNYVSGASYSPATAEQLKAYAKNVFEHADHIGKTQERIRNEYIALSGDAASPLRHLSPEERAEHFNNMGMFATQNLGTIAKAKDEFYKGTPGGEPPKTPITNQSSTWDSIKSGVGNVLKNTFSLTPKASGVSATPQVAQQPLAPPVQQPLAPKPQPTPQGLSQLGIGMPPRIKQPPRLKPQAPLVPDHVLDTLDEAELERLDAQLGE